METKSNIVVYCGNLPAMQMVRVNSLALELGAEVHVHHQQDPGHVRVELYTVIGEDVKALRYTAAAVCNYDLSRYEIADLTSSGLAQRVREHLTNQLGEFIRKEVLESLTPPPPYAETDTYFKRQKVFLASTGNRQKDKELVDAFDRYLHVDIPRRLGNSS